MLQGLRHYAITNAFQDSRFDPINHSEVPRLQCGVSVLTNFEASSDPFDWDIGKHGIQISFVDPKTKTSHRATYLPEVCLDQGWSHKECLHSLVRKAGYRGKYDHVEDLEVTRYESSKVVMEYDNYKTLRS